MGNTIKDLTGQKFGKWTVLYRDLSKKFKLTNVRWVCRCQCGTMRSMRGPQLRKIKYGCHHCASKDKMTFHHSGITRQISLIRRRSEKIGRIFSISNHQLYDLLIKQNFRCAISGEELFLRPRNQ